MTGAREARSLVTRPRRSRSVADEQSPTRLALDALMLNTLAATTVSRLLQHAHALITHGTDSHRLAQATAARAMPLA